MPFDAASQNWISLLRGVIFSVGESKRPPGDFRMKTLAETQKPSAKLAVLKPAKAENRAALAVLEQMYGYFSFDPMPMEADIRQAA
ncbi:hypothetical protein JWJ88_02045 [Paracoccus methylovorus]|uniref:Uncharacterized protein n=1 Tax=Paracoccus methylovorus TaxID=2812658 RepID=A0ABX7JLE3_9RHOB|nr:MULTISPECIES: hypothetical protein [Paracoccus]QRZ13467.1 hypothetical protein JWJ88_02045 [Paracoccus methylovorus]